MSPEGTSSGAVVVLALGRLLEAFDERLDVGVALHRQPDLALVVGGGRLQLGDVDRDADQAFHAAHQRERRLRVGGGGDVVGDARPTGSPTAGRPRAQALCSTPTIPVGPS